MLIAESPAMLPIPFNPAELASALPDVVAAIGIAFVFAIITFKPRTGTAAEDALEAMRVAQEQLSKQPQQPAPDEGS